MKSWREKEWSCSNMCGVARMVRLTRAPQASPVTLRQTEKALLMAMEMTD